MIHHSLLLLLHSAWLFLHHLSLVVLLLGVVLQVVNEVLGVPQRLGESVVVDQVPDVLELLPDLLLGLGSPVVVVLLFLFDLG